MAFAAAIAVMAVPGRVSSWTEPVLLLPGLLGLSLLGFLFVNDAVVFCRSLRSAWDERRGKRHSSVSV